MVEWRAGVEGGGPVLATLLAEIKNKKMEENAKHKSQLIKVNSEIICIANVKWHNKYALLPFTI